MEGLNFLFTPFSGRTASQISSRSLQAKGEGGESSPVQTQLSRTQTPPQSPTPQTNASTGLKSTPRSRLKAPGCDTPDASPNSNAPTLVRLETEQQRGRTSSGDIDIMKAMMIAKIDVCELRKHSPLGPTLAHTGEVGNLTPGLFAKSSAQRQSLGEARSPNSASEIDADMQERRRRRTQERDRRKAELAQKDAEILRLQQQCLSMQKMLQSEKEEQP